jgi:hypothetical protein
VPNGTLIVGTPQVRAFWQSVQALNVAFSVQRAVAEAPAGASGLLIVLLAVVQATGGALIAEYTNMLLLFVTRSAARVSPRRALRPRASHPWRPPLCSPALASRRSQDAYKVPQGGPGPNTIFAIAAALVPMIVKAPFSPVKGVDDKMLNTLVALALIAVNVATTPDKVQKLCTDALSWLPNGSVVEPSEPPLDEEEQLPWPLCDGLWGYELDASAYEGDDAFGNFFWAGDDEEEEEEDEAAAEGAAPAPKAKSPAAPKAKSPAAKAKSPAAAKAKSPKAKSPAPAPAASRRRAGSKSGK